MSPVSSPKYLIIIAGPTAVGKTAVAIEVAKHFHTDIVSADSRQLFKELIIGVARPSETELAEVKHHFIANKSIDEYISAGEYQREVMDLLHELYATKDVVVLCGGTGFYINALLYGLDKIPDIDPAVRALLNRECELHGLVPLQQRLKELDETSYHSIDVQNTQRVIRALEVCIGTGMPFSAFKTRQALSPLEAAGIIPVKIALNMPKEQLHQRINERVDTMMEAGFLEEAKSVHAYKSHNALQTVGYKELFDFVEGKCTLEEAVSLIKLHTRQYAKRQLTFFNKNDDYHWFHPSEIPQLLQFLKETIR